MRPITVLLALCAFLSPLAAQQRPIRLLDPAHVVDQRITSLPSIIRLSPKQKKKLRAIYMGLSLAERKIRLSNGGRFEKRQKIGVLERAADLKMRALLSSHQYVMIKNWEENQRRMGTVPHYKIKPH